MKKCPKCNTFLNTERKSCPLCSEILKVVDGETNPPKYPKPKDTMKKKSFFVKTLSFLTTLIVTGSILYNLITYRSNPSLWSLVVLTAVLYMWILLRVTFRGKSHIPQRLILQMITISVLTYAIDFVFKSTNWSINYVIPFISMASTITIIAVLFANRVKFGDYFLYAFACIIFGFVPFILWLFRVVDVLWPSLAAASLSFATLVSMIIFADQETKEELKKRFHI